MNDPISDLLTRIRNGAMARHASVRVPHSQIKARVLEIMRDEGFIEGFEVEGEGTQKQMLVFLKYKDAKNNAIKHIQRISKPGCRRYFPVKDLGKVRVGLGIRIISTSKGILTDREARRLNVGGEVLCELW